LGEDPANNTIQQRKFKREQYPEFSFAAVWSLDQVPLFCHSSQNSPPHFLVIYLNSPIDEEWPLNDVSLPPGGDNRMGGNHRHGLCVGLCENEAPHRIILFLGNQL